MSLSGSVRPVAQSNVRLKEAEKLGFKSAYAPKPGKGDVSKNVALHEIEDLAALIAVLGISASID